MAEACNQPLREVRVRIFDKKDFPVSNVRRFLEPGPIVLVSSAWKGKRNIMTMGWHMVMEFVPSLVGCLISSGNHSYELVSQAKECVINIPTFDIAKEVVGIGNCSGADVDKFEKFSLTPMRAAKVDAPLIGECHSSFECKVIDAGMVPKVEAALEALEAGVGKVHIIDARIPHSVLLEIYSNQGIGTEIVR